jgi:hypothetical protein
VSMTSRPIVTAVVLACCVLSAQSGAAQLTHTRASLDSSGVQGNGHSGGIITADEHYGIGMSSDGRYVVFPSDASNLVASDTNGTTDVFVRDRTTDQTIRVSVSSTGVEGNDWSAYPVISADGSTVAFLSAATNLVSGDTNGKYDVFVHDLSSQATYRVSLKSSTSVEGNDDCWGPPSLTSDGSKVAFTSFASNLVSGDANGVPDVFVRDRTTTVTTVVSVNSPGSPGNADSYFPLISGNGQYVAFTTQATDIVSGDTNNATDVVRYNFASGARVRISQSSGGTQGNDASQAWSINSTGTIVAFSSSATNLVASDTNSVPDVFLRFPGYSTTIRVSVSSTGTEGDNASSAASLSYNASTTGLGTETGYVAFESGASTLVANDGNQWIDIFVYEISTGLTTRWTETCTYQETQWGGHMPVISGDGGTVAFSSDSTTYVSGDSNIKLDIFVAEPRATSDATWSMYGSGLAGTLGVPTIASSADPILGSTISINVSNSKGSTTTGVFYTGIAQDSISVAGGTILVDADVTQYMSIPTAGVAIGADLTDVALCGLTVYCQMLEADSGAVQNVSFTRGLSLVMGDF